MARFVVTSGPIEHDGVLFSDGEELPIAASAAGQLLELGAIVLAEAAPKARKGKQPEGDEGPQE